MGGMGGMRGGISGGMGGGMGGCMGGGMGGGIGVMEIGIGIGACVGWHRSIGRMCRGGVGVFCEVATGAVFSATVDNDVRRRSSFLPCAN